MSSLLNRLLGDNRKRLEASASGPLSVDPTPEPVPAPTPEAPPNPDAPAGMSHDAWRQACAAALPEGAVMIPDDSCVYEQGGKRMLQLCKPKEGGGVELVGAPVEIPIQQTQQDPATVPEEDPMEPLSKAPDFLFRAFGLSEGATLGDVAAMAGTAQTAIKQAEQDASEKHAALSAAGVRPDLRAMVSGSLVRGAGQSWAEVVHADVTAHPSAYGSSTPSAAGDAPPFKAPLAAGTEAGRNDDRQDAGASLSPDARRKADVAAHRSKVNDNYKGRN